MVDLVDPDTGEELKPSDEQTEMLGKSPEVENTSSEESRAQSELPRYKSHKEVWALKIKNIKLDKHEAQETNRETDGSAMITPEEEGYAPFKVDHAYMTKHNPLIGGYYVVYKDGYKSFSPAEAFEEGYTLASVVF